MRIFPRVKFPENISIYDPENKSETVVKAIDLSLMSIKTKFFKLKSQNVLLKIRLNNNVYQLKAKVIIKKDNQYIVFLFDSNFPLIAASIGKYIENHIDKEKICPYCCSKDIVYLMCKSCKMPLNFSDENLLKKLSQIKLKDIILDKLNETFCSSENEDVNLDFIENDTKNLIKKYAITDFPILILGETGTGKTFVAKLVHMYSNRKNEEFVHINCANIPSELFESEIFGYEKGAFTGANKKKEGLIVKANKGTLFLDEIGELPIIIQTKLLKLLDNKTYYPLGSNIENEIDIRLISATNQDLETLINERKFREDLYHRINALKIELKPLRERKEFIIKIAYTLLKKYSNKLNKKNLEFKKDAIDLMLEYSWPGNIRELENVIKRVVVLADHKKISQEDLMLKIDDKKDNYSSKKIIDKEILQEKYKETNGNISKISRLLGISRPTVYKLLKRYNIN